MGNAKLPAAGPRLGSARLVVHVFLFSSPAYLGGRLRSTPQLAGRHPIQYSTMFSANAFSLSLLILLSGAQARLIPRVAGSLALSTALSFAPIGPLVGPTLAEDPTITAQVNFDVKIAPSSSSRRFSVGVYGNEAPLTSKVFLSLCSGENAWDVSFDSSQVSRILKDQRIDVGKFSKGGSQRQERSIDSIGKVRVKSVNVAENTKNTELNTLHHTSGGEVSMKKGGGSFEFTIAPRPNPSLDDGQIIFGKVVDGMDVIEEINNVPASKEDALGTKSAFSSAGKSFDGRAKLAMPVGRPLRKISIVSCELEDKASLSSFMRF